MKTITITIQDRDYILEIGQNQQENDNIIRNSQPRDLWFHLDNYSGPHFVLHTFGDPIPKRYLNYIGGLFPNYKNGLARRYSVIYTEIENVQMTNTPGTVIPHKTKKIKY
uniref:NFACT RNA-binding domain-containing protein n=1 Tax=viral metagenome TaxID=1070528 RepID=A0A6C0H8B4_9ZZZZ